MIALVFGSPCHLQIDVSEGNCQAEDEARCIRGQASGFRLQDRMGLRAVAEHVSTILRSLLFYVYSVQTLIQGGTP